MPITQYNQVPNPRVEGMPCGGKRRTEPYTLAKLAQVSETVIADASEAAGEDWSITVTDSETGQQYSLAFLSGADLETTLDNAIAALAGDGKFNDLFAATEDGTDTLTLTGRHVGRGYAINVTPGGSATAVTTVTQVAGGANLEFGRMLGVAGRKLGRQLTTGDTVRDLAGVLFRTDFNHTRPFEPADARAGFDGMVRGKTVSLMREGRVAVLPVSAPSALNDSVYVRIADGNLGAFSAAADGGDTLDISSVARWVSLPDAQGLCELRVNML